MKYVYLGMTDQLRQVLLEEDKVAVCRIQKRSNETPRFHALVPQRREAGAAARSLRVPEGFYVVPLPFADDISMFQSLFAYSFRARCLLVVSCDLHLAFDTAPGSLPPGFALS